ncbi:MAG: GNAT family N-acetyltransferase [Candidatus Bathyarchaeia archaeon]
MSFRIIDGKCYAFSDEDLWALAEMETHPEVVKWNIGTSTDDTNKMYNLFKEAINKLPREKNQIFLVGKLYGKVVGFIGIHCETKRSTHVGNVGITIHPNYWNMGFGTLLLKAGVVKAREEGLMKLEAETLFSNEAMIKIAEKVGFKVESIRKKLIEKSGKREDIALLSMFLK